MCLVLSVVCRKGAPNAVVMVCVAAIVCISCQHKRCKTFHIVKGLLFAGIAGFSKRCSYLGFHFQTRNKEGFPLLRFVVVYSKKRVIK